MDMEHAVAIIESHADLHGDHFIFNSQEFVAWCEQEGGPILSLAQANHELAPFCQRVGYSEPVCAWRYYLT